MDKINRLILVILFVLCANLSGFSGKQTTVTFTKTSTEFNLLEKDKKGKTYWINSKTMKRHNKSCRWYGNTKSGYYTDKKVGSACGICGG